MEQPAACEAAGKQEDARKHVQEAYLRPEEKENPGRVTSLYYAWADLRAFSASASSSF